MKSETLVDVIGYINIQTDEVKRNKFDYSDEDYITIMNSLQITKAVLIDCRNRLQLREEIEREVREEIEE